jgi:hypothetical protein
MDEHEAQVVARSVAFFAHLKHVFQMRTPDYIELVAGEQKQAPALVEALVQDLEQRMAAFSAAGEFEVDLDIEEEGEE